MKTTYHFLTGIFLTLTIIISSCGQSAKDNVDQQNNALSVIQNRKSVREFIKGRPIDQTDLTTIIKAGMAAPSGKDIRPWEIVVIDNKDIMEKMAAKLPTAKMLADAPMAIVVCGDSTRSSYWYLDCSAVTQNILLAAEALELGAVWTAAYPYQDRMNIVSENIGLPSHILPLAVIPIGHPAKKQSPKNKYDESKIHINKW